MSDTKTKRNPSLVLRLKKHPSLVLRLKKQPSLVLRLKKKYKSTMPRGESKDNVKVNWKVFERINSLYESAITHRKQCETLVDKINGVTIGPADPNWFKFPGGNEEFPEETIKNKINDNFEKINNSVVETDAFADKISYSEEELSEMVAFLYDLFEL